jgi:hypothetical protein
MSSTIDQQYEPVFLGTQGVTPCFFCREIYYLSTLTRRHIGAARTRDTSPAAISNCTS